MGTVASMMGAIVNGHLPYGEVLMLISPNMSVHIDKAEKRTNSFRNLMACVSMWAFLTKMECNSKYTSRENKKVDNR